MYRVGTCPTVVKVQASQTIPPPARTVYKRGFARGGRNAAACSLNGTWRFSSVPRNPATIISCCKATARLNAYVSQQQTRVQEKQQTIATSFLEQGS
jgi:hypothetical protein